ncbi:MAG TPA: group I intron-associated PD-(D/E)XK endonuclease [Ktedonobacteraceae bacterium]|nr:group I intron-associated PD-(D/E)XK endonuclease [Ktedonobacteraceae bacterium]
MGFFKPKPKDLTRGMKGNISETTVLQRLVAGGYVVLIPYGGSERYDFVIEDGDGNFWRIQVKTGWKHATNGAVQFWLYSVNPTLTKGKGNPRKLYTQRDCDYFAVYYPENGKVYLVPLSAFREGQTMGYLRLSVPMKRGFNSHKTDILMAEDYEI